MAIINFADDKRNMQGAQQYVEDCAKRKGVRLPPGVDATSTGLKDTLLDRDPSTSKVSAVLVEKLVSAGASKNDAQEFAACVKSMLDVYGGKIRELIQKGYGTVSHASERFILVPKNLTPTADENQWIWDGSFAQPLDYKGNPIAAAPVVIAVVATIPEWIVVAVAAVAVLVFVAVLPGGGGKTWIEHVVDAIRNVFGW